MKFPKKKYLLFCTFWAYCQNMCLLNSQINRNMLYSNASLMFASASLMFAWAHGWPFHLQLQVVFGDEKFNHSIHMYSWKCRTPYSLSAMSHHRLVPKCVIMNYNPSWDPGFRMIETTSFDRIRILQEICDLIWHLPVSEYMCLYYLNHVN